MWSPEGSRLVAADSRGERQRHAPIAASRYPGVGCGSTAGGGVHGEIDVLLAERE
jgi:hypothetical protein